MTEHAHDRARTLVDAFRRGLRDEDPYELHADALKALAHPKRLLILDLLRDGSERKVTDLLDGMRISQSNLRQNLAIMRTAGLLAARREANVVWYRVADARVVKAVDLVRAVLADHGDPDVKSARAAARRKEGAKRTAALSLTLLAGVAMTALALASLHALFVGESVPGHMVAMLDSPGPATLWERCLDVVTAPAMARPEAAVA